MSQHVSVAQQPCQWIAPFTQQVSVAEEDYGWVAPFSVGFSDVFGLLFWSALR